MALADEKERPVVGGVVTRRVSEHIAESIYTGRMGAELIVEVRRQLEPLLLESKRLDWLVNLESVKGVDMAQGPESSGFLGWFRGHGGDRIAVVITSTAVRMAMSAVAFATGGRVRFFETRREALAHLQAPRKS